MRFQDFHLMTEASVCPAWPAPTVVSPAVALTAAYVRPHATSLKQQLAVFDTIKLTQMHHVALLNRAETKFMLHKQTLLALLPALRNDYDVLVVAGERSSRYRTIYYDTADFALYHSHHAGALNRYKVRAREYVDTALSFLEIKHKTNKKRTVKYRLPTPQLATTLADANAVAVAPFLQESCPYQAQELQPVLWNHYRRITLVSKRTRERVTIDLDLSFSWARQQKHLPQLVIAEVKQAGRNQPSPFIQQMRGEHIHSGGFSKYCMGVTLLYPAVKANRFKKKQRQVAKLTQSTPWSDRS